MNGCYSIISKDNVLVERKIKEIKAGLSHLDYDLITFSMDESKLDSVIEEIETPGLFVEYKIIVCNYFEQALSSKNDERIIEIFLKDLERKLVDVTVVLIFKEIESSNKFFKKIKTLSKVITLSSLDNLGGEEFIKEYARSNDFNISKRAIDELLTRTSLQTDTIVNELDKLFLYKIEDKNIEVEDVILLVNRNIEDNIFLLIDMVLQKDSKRAIEIYYDMLELNSEQTTIIALLLTKFNEMYDVKSLVEGGYKQNDIVNLYNVKSGRAFYMMKNANMASKKSILQNINTLSELEYNIKSGKEDKKIGFELYLLSLRK